MAKPSVYSSVTHSLRIMASDTFESWLAPKEEKPILRHEWVCELEKISLVLETWRSRVDVLPDSKTTAYRKVSIDNFITLVVMELLSPKQPSHEDIKEISDEYKELARMVEMITDAGATAIERRQRLQRNEEGGRRGSDCDGGCYPSPHFVAVPGETCE